MQAIKLLPQPERETAKAIVVHWPKARAKLTNRLLQNILRTMAATADCAVPAPENFPFSYCNINPHELILTFNYGDTVRFSGEKEKLANLIDDERNEAYYKNPVFSPSPGSAICTSASPS
jgi:hypothetical protein